MSIEIEIKPITVNQAREFLGDITLLVYRGELTHEAAAAKIELLWYSIVHSILKNKEEWDGKITDYGFLDEQVQWLKSRLVKEKLAQATIDTQKDKIVIDGVQVYPTNVNLDIETEFVYQMGQNAKPHKKHKKLTIEWSEPCESNPVDIVAPPPPYHNIGEEQTLNTVKGFENTEMYEALKVIQESKQLGRTQTQIGCFFRYLSEKFCTPKVDSRQPIVKEDQQTATPPKSR
jgi:hypothetical protein